MEEQKCFYIRKENDKEWHAIPIPENTPEYRQQYQEALLDSIAMKKKLFQYVIDSIRSLMRNTLLTRSVYSLSDTKRKDFEKCQQEWNKLMSGIDFVEKTIKRHTNSLFNLFHGNENGEFPNSFYMINNVGFEDADYYTEGCVPEMLSSYLFELLGLFCALSSDAMMAIMIQHDVISIFENNSQEIRQILHEEIATISDVVSNLSGQFSNQYQELKETLAGQKKVTQNKQDDLADWVLAGMARYCKKNQEEINDRINEGIHLPRKPTIIKMFNHWNRYLAADENKKATMQDYVPYPKYESILFDSKDNVEKWGEQIFAPTCLHERVKKKRPKKREEKKERKMETRCA